MTSFASKCPTQVSLSKPTPNRGRWYFVGIGLLLLAVTLAACGGSDSSKGPPDTALMRMLRFVPDTAEFREYLTFGDAAAWHASWNIPRVNNRDMLDLMDRDSRGYWMFILPRQTTPPQTLGAEYLFLGEQRDAVGFDLFNLDRYVGAGNPPNWITIVEFGFDGAQIGDALIGTGYTAEELEGGGTLYSIYEDFEVNLQAELQVMKLGNLNRIVLLDGQMVIAKATAIVTNALAANSGKRTSLADNANYIAAATALEDKALADMGELVGVILMDGLQLSDPGLLMPESEEVLEQLTQSIKGTQLPTYTLVAFATRHAKGASHLILAVVFPKETDAAAAAEVLAERMRNYTSLRTRSKLDEYWSFEKAISVEANGLPVALVVMQVDDPEPTPEDAAQVNAGVFSWVQLVTARDTLFLATELPTQ
jgi:hypothetical protein